MAFSKARDWRSTFLHFPVLALYAAPIYDNLAFQDRANENSFTIGGASCARGPHGGGAECERSEGPRRDRRAIRAGAAGDAVWNAGGCGMPQSHRAEPEAGARDVRGRGSGADAGGRAERRAGADGARISEP